MSESTVRPTRQRFLVVLAATLMAVLLYLDRFAISISEIYIRQGLNLSNTEIGWILSAFFYSYALGQVPAGWLTDRFGARKMLTIYIVVWSAFTALTGLAAGFVALFLFRLGFGFGQAGAYPTAASMISKWVPFTARGTASSVVAMGGRVGGALAPFLTALLIVVFVPLTIRSLLGPRDLLELPRTAFEMASAELAESDTPTNHDQRLQAEAGRAILQRMETSAAEQLKQLAGSYRQALKTAQNTAAAKGGDPQKATPLPGDIPEPDQGAGEAISAALNDLLVEPDLFSDDVFNAVLPQLPSQGKQLRRQQQQLQVAGKELDRDALERLNRLTLEVIFPGIRRIYGEGWRDVMYVYGALGVLVALLFWWQVYDEPALHPRVNSAELALIQRGRPPSVAGSQGHARGLPFKALLTSRNMWLTSISQFTTNYGWVFLVTYLPRYLDEVHRLPIEQRGLMTSLPITVGWIGMLAGGPLTDWMTRRFGMRWGRALPMGLTRFLAMAGYLVCLADMLWWSGSGSEGGSSPWISVAALSLVAFATDLGVPAVWAFQQDIAGRYVGSALGWGNMWGNFGAGIASNTLLMFVMLGWDWMFAVTAGAFFISGVAALLIDSRIPLVPAEVDEE